MKKIYFILIALLTAVLATAQTDSDMRSATLIHGDQTTVFYTAKALYDAEKAAKDGDVIILSPGYFDRTTTSKSLSIYGSGFDTEVSSIEIKANTDIDNTGNKYCYYPTVRLEGFKSSSINIPSSGYKATIKDLVVRKCKLNYISFSTDTEGCRLSQCVLTGSNYIYGGNSKHDGLTLENCHIYGFYSSISDPTNNILFDHCILKGYTQPVATYTNCILLGCSLSDYSTASNCIFSDKTPGSNVTATDCWYGIEPKYLFAAEGEDGNYSDDKDFALKRPDLYTGTDGTEAGINGGHGFSRIPVIPRIVSSEIDTRPTADGKINVSIKVEAQTKE